MNLKEKLIELKICKQNEYLNLYVELITKNIQTKKEAGVTQSHHIIPRFYFKAKKLKVDNSKSNLVNLSYAEHVLAHYYLTLCSFNQDIKVKNELALLHLNSHKLDITFIEQNLPLLNDLYKEMFESKIGHEVTEETKKKISEANKGRIGWNKNKPLSEEHKQNISKALKGRIISPEQREKISKALKGRTRGVPRPWITEKLKGREFTPEWRDKISKALKGRPCSENHKKKQSLTMLQKHKHWYTNGEINLSLSEKDIIPEGFVRGRTLKK